MTNLSLLLTKGEVLERHAIKITSELLLYSTFFHSDLMKKQI